MLDFINDTFTEFNQRYFKGKLQPIPIELTHKDYFKGAIFYKNPHQNPHQNPHPFFKFSIPFLKKAKIKEIKGAVLHEMIHYFFWFFNIKDESSIISGHSPIFKRVKRNLERKEGITIPLN